MNVDIDVLLIRVALRSVATLVLDNHHERLVQQAPQASTQAPNDPNLTMGSRSAVTALSGQISYGIQIPQEDGPPRDADDAFDIEAGHAALAEFRAKGGKSLAQVRREIAEEDQP